MLSARDDKGTARSRPASRKCERRPIVGQERDQAGCQRKAASVKGSVMLPQEQFARTTGARARPFGRVYLLQQIGRPASAFLGSLVTSLRPVVTCLSDTHFALDKSGHFLPETCSGAQPICLRSNRGVSESHGVTRRPFDRSCKVHTRKRSTNCPSSRRGDSSGGQRMRARLIRKPVTPQAANACSPMLRKGSVGVPAGGARELANKAQRRVVSGA